MGRVVQSHSVSAFSLLWIISEPQRECIALKTVSLLNQKRSWTSLPCCWILYLLLCLPNSNGATMAELYNSHFRFFPFCVHPPSPGCLPRGRALCRTRNLDLLLHSAANLFFILNTTNINVILYFHDIFWGLIWKAYG